MTLSIAFELNDRDLAHFINAQAVAERAAAGKSPDEIVAAAVALLEQAQETELPDFITARLLRMDDLIAMLRDEGWALPPPDRQRVLSALVYFADPKDVIPDTVPVFGFLDDAIMIELCVGKLQHELTAYDEFCDFRAREARRRGIDPATVGHADWLAARREELHERMHNRGEREFGSGYGRSSGYAAHGADYVDRSWRPSVFRVR